MSVSPPSKHVIDRLCIAIHEAIDALVDADRTDDIPHTVFPRIDEAIAECLRWHEATQDLAAIETMLKLREMAGILFGSHLERVCVTWSAALRIIAHPTEGLKGTSDDTTI